MEETTTIATSELKELVESSIILQKLMAGGVDNWEGYEDALAQDTLI